MKIAIALLVVFSAVFMAAADEKAEEADIQEFLRANDLPANDVEEEPELDFPEIEKRRVNSTVKPVVIVDKLSYRSCRYILEKGLCKLHAILRKLCPALCRCKDILSKRSCGLLKEGGYCKNNALARTKCRFTCRTCIRRFIG
ncbi:uncharacterized protein LOC110233182 [Exaiptasia diaphana]|uniref:ShKT domain-containing protein n=1 Tax=Exaiptasia diaphana TaxID=2652724 RepID=A0A913WU10_EXADI|nr:uncharacterized protein LOC110233182 [Exaiptasia diaphana]KXJ21003.1 hypothetical protein AC249_AIPGENE14139 [Exaiptasia diaphana]